MRKTIGRWLAAFHNTGSKDPALLQKCHQADLAEAKEFSPSRDFFIDGIDLTKKPHSRLRVGKPFFTDEMFLRQQERADWGYTDVRIRFFAGRFAHQMRQMGIPIYCHAAFRTPQEQRQLQKRGVSKAAFPNAPHTQGCAVDLVHSRFHWNDMRKEDWDFFGHVGKTIAARHKIPITWGGDWKFYDPAHWELSDWRGLIIPIPRPRHTPLRRTLFHINRNTSLPTKKPAP